MPVLEGFVFGARMLPARAVGGDLFDFIPLEPGCVGIVVGDVSGKGPPAALFMALTRSLVRAEASRYDDPGATLERVNRHLLAMNASGMFVTMLYGMLDGPTGRFAYASAGHELPILVDRSGDVSMPARGDGNPLAMLEVPDLDEQTIMVPAGASLVLYIDGVTDALDEGGAFFGLERLVAALGVACSTGEAICHQVLATVLAHQGTAQQHDDVTLVALRAADAM
jgi:sigma-B regulation protein RsbU (phosphoserine phosphatase)